MSLAWEDVVATSRTVSFCTAGDDTQTSGVAEVHPPRPVGSSLFKEVLWEHCLTPVRLMLSSQHVLLQQCICASDGSADPTAALLMKRYRYTPASVATPVEVVAAHSHLTLSAALQLPCAQLSPAYKSQPSAQQPARAGGRESMREDAHDAKPSPQKAQQPVLSGSAGPIRPQLETGVPCAWCSPRR